VKCTGTIVDIPAVVGSFGPGVAALGRLIDGAGPMGSTARRSVGLQVLCGVPDALSWQHPIEYRG